jgi:hypothetical protein
MRVMELEEEAEALKQSSRKEDIDDLKAKLSEKTHLCDSQRHQIKVSDLHLRASQDQVMKLTNAGECPQEAAHLIRLPRSIYSCSECYANNL